MKLVIAAFMLAAQLATPAPEVDALLNDAATDFQTHGSGAADVRDVYAGILPDGPGSAPRTIICGRFLPAGNAGAEWTDFATIRTSGYEQWLGSGATSYCSRATIDRTPGADLTQVLKHRLGLK